MIAIIAQTLPATLPVDPNHLLIKDVREFYETAWTHLLWTVSSLFLVLGLIFPFFLQWWQRKSSLQDQKKLEGDLQKMFEDEKSNQRTQVAAIRTELDQALKSNLSESEKALRDSLAVEISKAKALLTKSMMKIGGDSHFFHGNAAMESNSYLAAYIAFKTSALAYAEIREDSNLIRVVGRLVTCLGHLSKSEIDDLVTDGHPLQPLIEKIEACNEHGALKDLKLDLKQAYRDASERVPAAAGGSATTKV